MTIRIDVASLDLRRSATWYADGSVVIHNGRCTRCTAHTRADFDALCDTWEIERVGRGTSKRAIQQKVIEEILF